ncbi:MAG: hypothetical protein AAGK14_03155 [Verrucomicrobiota bacterium]
MGKTRRLWLDGGLWVLFLLLAGAPLTTCAQADLQKLFGSWTGNQYRNSYFGFSLRIPSTMHFLDEESRGQAAELTEQLSRINDPDLRKKVLERDTRQLKLVHVGQYPLGAKVPLNPNIVITAVNKSILPNVSTPEHFLELTLLSLKKAGIPYKMEPINQANIGNRELPHLRTEIDFRDRKLLQDAYCLVRKDYMLGITIVYTDEEQRQKLQQILDSIQFTD